MSNSCNFIAQGVRFFVTFKRKKSVYLIGTNTKLKKKLVLGRSYRTQELQVESLMCGTTINTGLRLQFFRGKIFRPTKCLTLFPGCFYK